MAYVMVDIESDGPAPGLYSMISFGAVIVDNTLDKTFYGELKPITNFYNSEALAVSGFTREETLKFSDPYDIMLDFEEWINLHSKNHSIFISDNNGFDWQFINYYFWKFLHRNPFGYSSMNLGSFYKGCALDTFKNFKHLRKTKHTHNPVDDAIGNAEAFLEIIKEYEVNIKL